MSTLLRFFVIVTTALALCVLPRTASGQDDPEGRQRAAIDAVAAFLKGQGETRALEQWTGGWAGKTPLYTFAVLPPEVEAIMDAGEPNIVFNSLMVDQILAGGRVDRAFVADWAATFTHELVHTTQSAGGYIASAARRKAGGDHPFEASAWARGLVSYWKWLRVAYTNSQRGPEEERQRFRLEAVELATSFETYYNNYVSNKHGPLPSDLKFVPLQGTDTFPVTIQEALKEVAAVRKRLSENLHVVVRLHRYRILSPSGEEVTIMALPDYGVGGYTYLWKADGATLPLPETGQTLTRRVTVNEIITVTVQDNHRGQKASVSCEIVVTHGPPVPPAAKTAPATPPAPPPKTGAYGWVYLKTQVNEWQTKLDHDNAAAKGWKYSVETSEGNVTITSTYVGTRTDNWAKNGMSESGTATWSVPSLTLIRPGDKMSVALSTLNAPRDHSNFFGIISITVQVWQLDKGGARTGRPAYFADAKGREILGYGYPRGNQPKTLQTMTVVRTFAAGTVDGQLMSICVNAQGVGQSVQTEYVYQWKKW